MKGVTGGNLELEKSIVVHVWQRVYTGTLSAIFLSQSTYISRDEIGWVYLPT